MAYLRELLTNGREIKHPLKFGVNQIGRLLDNQIIVKDRLVSRYHAEIIITSHGTLIRDLRSANHSYVNDREIREVNLQEGDRLRFGNTIYVYSQQSLPQPRIPRQPRNYQPSIIKQYDRHANSDRNILSKIARSTDSGKSVVKIYREEDENNSNNKGDRAVEKLKLLLEISQQLCSPQEPEKMLTTILELLFKVMDIDRAAILLVDEISQELECEVAKTKPEIKLDEPIYSRNIVDRVWETGQTLVAGDIPQNQELKNAPSVLASS
ncbi:MAG: FHA domain-containing protein, partial [Cyanobacteria bacterium P01_C01_bin.72]